MNKKIVEKFKPLLNDAGMDLIHVSDVKHGDYIIIVYADETNTDDLYTCYSLSMDSKELFKELFHDLACLNFDKWDSLPQEQLISAKAEMVETMRRLYADLWPNEDVPDITWDWRLYILADDIEKFKKESDWDNKQS